MRLFEKSKLSPWLISKQTKIPKNQLYINLYIHSTNFSSILPKKKENITKKKIFPKEKVRPHFLDF